MLKCSDFIFLLFFIIWSIEFSSIKATIMPPKVCEVVSAPKSIRAGKDESSWAIEPTKPLISPNAFAASNLRIFRGFLKRWSRLGRLYDSCHRKFRARERLVEVRPIWRIDRGTYDGSPRQGGSPPGGGWKRHMPIWRSRIRGRVLKLCIKFVHVDYTLKNECSNYFKLLQKLHFHHHFYYCSEILYDDDDYSIV